MIDNGSEALPPLTAAADAGRLSWNARDVNLSCHITTHRIVLLDEKHVIGGSIPLPLVQSVQKGGGPSLRSPRASYKIELSTHAWGELIVVFRGGETSSYTQSGKDREDALDAIERAMKRKAWQDKERVALKEESRPSNVLAAKKVGVDAILTKNALRREYQLAHNMIVADLTPTVTSYSQIEKMPIWRMWHLGAETLSLLQNRIL